MQAPTPVQSGSAPVHGLQLYYELHGPANEGQPPLVLLHGGGDTIETSFAAILPLLARTRRVIAFEQQGYGRSTDVAERPFSFTQSADDTVALLDHLHVAQADLLGFSNGGTIVLQMAIRHAQRVRRMLPVSTFFSRAGAPPQFWEWMRHAALENMPQELQEAYRRVAPHPENLRMMHDKAAQRMRDFQDIPEELLRSIAAPSMIIAGDRDVVLPEHTLALSRLLPNAQLAILPGADHMAVMRQTHLLVPMIEAFLNAEAPPP